MGSCDFCKVDPKEPLKSCVCKKVSYCSKECQVKDWKNHKPSCPPYVIREAPGKGKGMFATRKIKEGQVILEEYPLITVRKGLSIADFMVLHYLKLDGETKAKILELFDPAENFKILDSKTVDELISKDKNRQLWKEAESNELVKICGSDELVKIFRIFCHNAFQVCEDPSLNSNDIGLYSHSCLINHSCNPNSRTTWVNGDSKRRQVRALKTIEKDEEINIIYNADDGVHYSTRDLRREKLFERMAFLCQCSECSLEGRALEENERMRVEIREKYAELENLLSRGRGSLGNRPMMIAVERLELVKKLDYRMNFVIELLQVYKLAADSKMLGISAPDPNTFKREALDYAKKQGDVGMYEYKGCSEKLNIGSGL